MNVFGVKSQESHGEEPRTEFSKKFWEISNVDTERVKRDTRIIIRQCRSNDRL
jgi:hypothetical protein